MQCVIIGGWARGDSDQSPAAAGASLGERYRSSSGTSGLAKNHTAFRVFKSYQMYQMPFSAIRYASGTNRFDYIYAHQLTQIRLQ